MGEQEREEEEEDREEARRIDAELAQRLEGAFDDLDFDDDDDSSLCSPPGGFNHVGLSPFIFAYGVLLQEHLPALAQQW